MFGSLFGHIPFSVVARRIIGFLGSCNTRGCRFFLSTSTTARLVFGCHRHFPTDVGVRFRMPHFQLARLDLALSACVGVVEDTASGRGQQRRPADGNANNSARAPEVVVAIVLGTGSGSLTRSLCHRAESDKAHIRKGGHVVTQEPSQLSNGNRVAIR